MKFYIFSETAQKYKIKFKNRLILEGRLKKKLYYYTHKK